MLYSEIIAVCSQIHTKHINTLCGQNVEFVDVWPDGTYCDHWASKRKQRVPIGCVCQKVVTFQSPINTAQRSRRQAAATKLTRSLQNVRWLESLMQVILFGRLAYQTVRAQLRYSKEEDSWLLVIPIPDSMEQNPFQETGFHATRSFITLLTKAHHLKVPWTRWIQRTTSHRISVTSILILLAWNLS
jgi:hypothetical protein